jgi:hypothetical protein
VAGALATPLGLLAVWWATLAVLLVWRRWRHLLVCAVALFVVTLGSSLAVDMLRRPRPLGLETLGDWEGPALPSLPMAFLTAILSRVAICTPSSSSCCPSGRTRSGSSGGPCAG